MYTFYSLQFNCEILTWFPSRLVRARGLLSLAFHDLQKNTLLTLVITDIYLEMTPGTQPKWEQLQLQTAFMISLLQHYFIEKKIGKGNNFCNSLFSAGWFVRRNSMMPFLFVRLFGNVFLQTYLFDHWITVVTLCSHLLFMTDTEKISIQNGCAKSSVACIQLQATDCRYRSCLSDCI